MSAKLRSEITVRDYRCDQVSGSQPLEPHDIHVWILDLATATAGIENDAAVLSADETNRADRFRFQRDRHEFVATRSALRRLIGEYVGLSPAEVRFHYTPYGRPSLGRESAAKAIEFNVSHSGGYSLLSFAQERRLGVDIELVRRDFSTLEIAERFFSQVERNTLRCLPVEARHEAFFRCWTRKEAFIKALGEGLSHPLDQFDVTLEPGVPAALLATRPTAEEAKRWQMWDIEVPNGYVAALVAQAT